MYLPFKHAITLEITPSMTCDATWHSWRSRPRRVTMRRFAVKADVALARSPLRARERPRAMSLSANARDVLVQYVVMRRDLSRALAWPVGALCAQVAHACVAAIVTYNESEDTKAYVSEGNVRAMRKVVLECANERELDELAAVLSANAVEHYAWREEPEGTRTCVATRPYRKSDVSGYFKKFNLASDVCVPRGEGGVGRGGGGG